MIRRTFGGILVVISVLVASCNPSTGPSILIEKDYIAEHPDWTPVGAEQVQEGKVVWMDVEIPLKVSLSTALDADSCYRLANLSVELMKKVGLKFVETRVDGSKVGCGIIKGNDDRRTQRLFVVSDMEKGPTAIGKGIKLVEINGLGEIKFQ